MALYDISNPLHFENFKLRVDKLLERREGIVELTLKKQRSLAQNNCLHLLLSYVGGVTGTTTDYVKTNYFKIHVNPETFIRKSDDKLIGGRNVLRSSSDLTTEEMTLCIERFRNWAAQELEIYLPSPDERGMLTLMEIEVSKFRCYI